MAEETVIKIKRLLASAKCVVCGQHYEMDNIDVLGHQEDLWFLQALCSSCQTQYLVAVVVEKKKTPRAITDLTKAELVRFSKVGELTGDDVLDMHNFLKHFSGDFSRLLDQREV